MMHAVKSSVTLTAVLNIPKIRSIPIIIMRPSMGISAFCNTDARIITLPPGMAGVPIDAATTVQVMSKYSL